MISSLEERGVECETLRLVDLNILPGVGSDEGHGKEWPHSTARTCAHNLFHVARALREHPIPAE